MNSNFDCKWEPKDYYDNGCVLNWGKNLTKGEIRRMKNGEVFTLLSRNRYPYSIVLMDSYGQIRERKLEIRNGK